MDRSSKRLKLSINSNDSLSSDYDINGLFAESKLKWNDILVDKLVEIYKSQFKYIDSITYSRLKLKSVAWNRIVVEFNNYLFLTNERALVTKEQLQSKLQWLKKSWQTYKLMKNHSGWSWDDIKNCPVCDDDDWNEFIKDHKEAKTFRKNGVFVPFMWFNECEELFSKTIFDGARKLNETSSINITDYTLNDNYSQDDDDHELDDHFSPMEINSLFLVIANIITQCTDTLTNQNKVTSYSTVTDCKSQQAIAKVQQLVHTVDYFKSLSLRETIELKRAVLKNENSLLFLSLTNEEAQLFTEDLFQK